MFSSTVSVIAIYQFSDNWVQTNKDYSEINNYYQKNDASFKTNSGIKQKLSFTGHNNGLTVTKKNNDMVDVFQFNRQLLEEK